MKAAMNAHVDQERHVMFQESADEVQKRLKKLVQGVEETMSNRVDEVFIAMRRDYRSVLGGEEVAQGQVLPKAQRLMRKEVLRIIETVESLFQKVVDGEVEKMRYDEEGVDSLLDNVMDGEGDDMKVDEETTSMNGDQEHEIDGTTDSRSGPQDASRDVVSGSNKSSKSLAAADQKIDAGNVEKRTAASTPVSAESKDEDSNGSENESVKGVDTRGLDDESSEEEYQDPGADSPAESGTGHWDSDDD